ncbi:hypothetical protein [Plantactinospora endophytica]|nr:hypothetical protein [Plantactinospora endophytica]
MIRQRVLAVLLLVIGFLALALSQAFPVLDDLPTLAKSAIAVAGAASTLTGVWLWFRKTPEGSSPQTTGDDGR